MIKLIIFWIHFNLALSENRKNTFPQFEPNQCEIDVLYYDKLNNNMDWNTVANKTWQCGSLCQPLWMPCLHKCFYGYLLCDGQCVLQSDASRTPTEMFLCNGKCIDSKKPCDGKCDAERYLNCEGECSQYFISKGILIGSNLCNGVCQKLSRPCGEEGKCIPDSSFHPNCDGVCQIRTEMKSFKCNGVCQSIDQEP